MIWKTMNKHTGLRLEQLCDQATYEVLLVAPFIKQATLKRLLDQIAPIVKVNCVTRWRPDEIVAGVSDLDIWLLIRERPNSSLWLRSDLHAKYYRGDKQVLIGSANLTNTALGWSLRPNLELLIYTELLPEFERELLVGSVMVDDSIYEQIKQMVEALPPGMMPKLDTIQFITESLKDDDLPVIPTDAWLPMLRRPESLFTAYIGEGDKLGTGSRIAAISDLQALDIPSGLNIEQFEAYVGVQLLQRPIVRQVDKFVEIPQRFGAVRDFLKTLPCAAHEGFDADIAWQTLMRWLIHFLPVRYDLSVPRHSEIFHRRA
jgi:hypothetical protein